MKDNEVKSNSLGLSSLQSSQSPRKASNKTHNVHAGKVIGSNSSYRSSTIKIYCLSRVHFLSCDISGTNFSGGIRWMSLIKKVLTGALNCFGGSMPGNSQGVRTLSLNRYRSSSSSLGACNLLLCKARGFTDFAPCPFARPTPFAILSSNSCSVFQRPSTGSA